MRLKKFTETADGKKIRKKAVLPLEALHHLLPENGCRYALYDAAYETEDTKKCQDHRLRHVVQAPDSCEVKEKMLYASSKEGVKKKFEVLSHSLTTRVLSFERERFFLIQRLRFRPPSAFMSDQATPL
uniref:ADF-H domain-containing protein n=1 Tax=Salarias fasciatus TaxID=181472 RepID=A0A672HL03_SALFA